MAIFSRAFGGCVEYCCLYSPGGDRHFTLVRSRGSNLPTLSAILGGRGPYQAVYICIHIYLYLRVCVYVYVYIVNAGVCPISTRTPLRCSI